MTRNRVAFLANHLRLLRIKTLPESTMHATRRATIVASVPYGTLPYVRTSGGQNHDNLGGFTLGHSISRLGALTEIG